MVFLKISKNYSYLSGTAIFSFLNTPSSDFFMKLDFYSKDVELVELTPTGILPLFIFCSSVLNFNILKCLSNYHYIQSNFTLALPYQDYQHHQHVHRLCELHIS